MLEVGTVRYRIYRYISLCVHVIVVGSEGVSSVRYHYVKRGYELPPWLQRKPDPLFQSVASILLSSSYHMLYSVRYVIRTTVYGVPYCTFEYLPRPNSIEKNPKETKTRHRLLSASNNKKSFLGRYRDEDILTPFTNTSLSEIA